nr:hypothetical protein [Nostoc sp. ChiQUE02]MDZ8231269.1 hypothetical protein [Nostoc sp. ChiQUE02]
MNISRRNSIKLLAAGTTGFLGTYLYSQKPAVAYASNWLDTFSWFTQNMYSVLIARTVMEYLNSLQEGNEIGYQIAKTNSQLANEDFGNLDYSSVYQNSYDFANRLYYPLVYDYCGCMYNISPFYNFECGCEPVTYIESPHIAGLALAANELKKKNISQNDVNSVLLPKQGRRIAKGNPTEGYKNPLEYAGDKSRVAVDYQPHPKNRTTGTVAVKAVDRGGRLLIDNEWTLNVGEM